MTRGGCDTEEDKMSIYGAEPGSALHEMSGPPAWVRILLGVVLLVAGILVLADVALAVFISSKLIGLIAMAAGAFEIGHAVWTKGWGGLLWQIMLGILYIALG